MALNSGGRDIALRCPCPRQSGRNGSCLRCELGRTLRRCCAARTAQPAAQRAIPTYQRAAARRRRNKRTAILPGGGQYLCEVVLKLCRGGWKPGSDPYYYYYCNTIWFLMG